MRRLFLTTGILGIALLTFWSCEHMNDTIINPDYSSPLLVAVDLDRPLVNLDTDTAVAVPGANNIYTVTVMASIRALRQSSSGPYAATISVFRPKATEAAIRRSSDLIQGSGDTLSGTVQLTFLLLRSDIGQVHFRCTVQPSTGQPSNELTQALTVTRRNSRPVISETFVPDTVIIGQIPSADSSFLVAAAVSDSDGISDINPFGGVQFLSVKPDSTLANSGFPIFLFDDGNENILFPPDGRSGDAVKGDGKFSFRVRLRARVRNTTPPPDSIDTQRGKYIFKFYAIDNSGASSDTVDKIITVR
jgi:hypothetical protein